jgi:hypothetical protein
MERRVAGVESRERFSFGDRSVFLDDRSVGRSLLTVSFFVLRS